MTKVSLSIVFSLLSIVMSLDTLAVRQGFIRPLGQVLAQADDGPVQEPPAYPAGEFCKRPDDVHGAKDHPCHCRDMESCAKPEDGQGAGPSENNHCAQWCHRDHCACKAHCE